MWKHPFLILSTKSYSPTACSLVQLSGADLGLGSGQALQRPMSIRALRWLDIGVDSEMDPEPIRIAGSRACLGKGKLPDLQVWALQDETILPAPVKWSDFMVPLAIDF